MKKAKKNQEPVRLLICGSRHWAKIKYHRQIIRRELEALMKKREIELVVEGGAEGADTIGREEAWRQLLPVFTVNANWVYLGRKAGPIRNRLMTVHFQPNYVLAFHDNIDESKGTKNMLDLAKKAKVKFKLVGAGYVSPRDKKAGAKGGAV